MTAILPARGDLHELWQKVLDDHAFGPWTSILDFCHRRLVATAGRGCSIWSAKVGGTGIQVALKIYEKFSLRNEVACRTIQREARIIRGLRNGAVCQMYGAFEDESHVYLVMDFCPDGNLSSYLSMKHSGEPLLEEQATNLVIFPVLQALRFLHFYGVIHRDVQPENVYLTQGSCTKLGNFKSAVNRRLYQPMSKVGTPKYMAPEVIKLNSMLRTTGDHPEGMSEAYNEKVDIWSCGVLAYELVVGKLPFGKQCEGNEALEEEVCSGDIPLPGRGGLSGEFLDFIQQALQQRHSLRPSAEQLLRHPWILKHIRVPVPTLSKLQILPVRRPTKDLVEKISQHVPRKKGRSPTEKFEDYVASLIWPDVMKDEILPVVGSHEDKPSPHVETQDNSSLLVEAQDDKPSTPVVEKAHCVRKPPLPRNSGGLLCSHPVDNFIHQLNSRNLSSKAKEQAGTEDSFITLLKAKGLNAKTKVSAGDLNATEEPEEDTGADGPLSGSPSPVTTPTSVIFSRTRQFTTWPHSQTRVNARNTLLQDRK